MKIFQKCAKILIIIFCMFTLLTAGINISNLTSTSFITSANAATALPAPSSIQPARDLQACPPSVIDGVVGEGSRDYPFVTGTQTSRLFRNDVESTCGQSKPFPGIASNNQFIQYDAYSFTNTAFTPVCVTIITSAVAADEILTVAYLNRFDPAHIEENYVGDAGNSKKTRSFSFIVPRRETFIIVQSRTNQILHPISVAYSFRVLGLPNCTPCPPTSITGTIGSGSTQYPASSDRQTGRILRTASPSTCDAPKFNPSIVDTETQFAYDAYTFLNNGPGAVCVTVTTTTGGVNQILTTAYLDRFDPLDVEENYLADAGNGSQGRPFSFTVPGRRSFVIVQSRVNNATNPGSLSYIFSVSGLPDCSCLGILNKTDESFAANGGTGTVLVGIDAGCNWTTDTFSSDFITITEGASGTGSGTVTYSVAPNTTPTRRAGVIAIAGQAFTILQGVQFNDVPVGAPFYTEIGKLSARNVTQGCSTGTYCPDAAVTRDQMAAFIIRGLGEFSPILPAQPRFNDVTTLHPFYGFIEEMAVRQISLGCSSNPPLYCPSDSVTREQMAAFLIRAKGEFDPPTPPSQRFNDVPPGNPFYKFIDRMAVLGITQGCTSNPPQYCPSSTVTRAQMAAFLVRAFNL